MGGEIEYEVRVRVRVRAEERVEGGEARPHSQGYG